MIRALLVIALAGCAAQSAVRPIKAAHEPLVTAPTAHPHVLAPQGSGVISGVLRDKQTGDPMVAATIVAVSPALQGEQVVICDDRGRYEIDGLPSGRYALTIYYSDYTFHRSRISVVNRSVTRANLRLDEEAAQRLRLAEIAAAQRKAHHQRTRHP